MLRVLSAPSHDAVAVAVVIGDTAIVYAEGKGTGTIAGVAVDGAFALTLRVPVRRGHAVVSSRGFFPRRARRLPVVNVFAPPRVDVPAISVPTNVCGTNVAVVTPVFAVSVEVP